ncbi:MAG: glycosyltransferase family 2 protein [Planctomycetaceae bacterium]|nr:glycosyltransferase family 2 protein [Planctomycetaceae bacterium]
MELVTTIIPVFNRAEMVCDAVKSVLAQTYTAIEVVLVDDGSTDNTPNTLRRLQQQHPTRIKLVRQDNAGPGAARNKGFQVATGDYIQYLDSDDLLHPEKFEKQVAALKTSPQCGVCYCITLRTDPKTKQLVPWARTAEQIDNIFPSFLPKRGWATLTPLWRRSVCDAIGPWKPYRVMEDWEHDLRAGILGVKSVHVPEALCTVVDHDQNRASGMNEGFTPERVRDFFRAHESIWNIMKKNGLTDWSYLQQFSRTMFWVARMCGERALKQEAEAALQYTEEMTTLNQQLSPTRRFRQLKSVLGWRASVWVAELLSKVRSMTSRKQPAYYE